MNTQAIGPKMKIWAGIFVMLVSMMVFLVPKTQAADKAAYRAVSHTTEAPVNEALETPSFGTEDFVLASESVTFGAEDWVPGMEFSGAVAVGTLPAPAPEELNLDDYNPD